MRRSIDRLLGYSTGALLVSSFLALASAPTLGIEMLVVAVLLLVMWPLGEALDRRFRSYRYITGGATVLFTMTLPVWVRATGLLPAVIALIVFVQAHKLAHQKERKDFYQLFLMCFLLLVAACGLGPGAAIGLAMLCFLISAAWAFLALQIRTEAREVGPSGLADVIPLSDREPEPTSPVPRLLDWGMVRAVGMVCLAATVLTAGFFFGMPRMEAGMLGRSNILTPTSAQQRTGLSDTVQVGSGGRIAVDRRPVMRVEFPDIPGGRYDEELYWRSSTMDTFMGGVWEQLGGPYAIRDGVPRPSGEDTGSTVSREPTGKGRLVRQSVYLEEVPQGGLPCLPSPVRLSCEGATVSWILDQDGYFVRAETRASSSIRYEVVSEVVSPSPEELREARTSYRQAMSNVDYYYLTRQDLRPATVGLAEQITRDYDRLYDKARALEAWLGSADFVYTLDQPTLPRHSPIDAFVLEARRGHCELFASALALMLRSLGIPTRVVSGYRGGQWDNGGYVISRDMAHLWVEAYFLDYGWITFDPSPQSQEPETTALGQMQLALSRWQWRLRMLWYSRVIGYEGGFTLERLKNLGEGLFSWRFHPFSYWLDENSGIDSSGGFLSGVVLPGLLLALALFALYLRFRRKSRRRGDQLTETQRRALRLLGRVRNTLKRRGIDSERKTAGELLRAARKARLSNLDGLAEALQTYNEVRFGNRPLERARLKHLLKRIRTVRTEP